MSKAMQLRCQFGGGQRKVLNGMTAASTLAELQEAIFLLTDVPVHVQKIMSGFPPKELDISKTDAVLPDIALRSGDTLIIEENNENKPKIISAEIKEESANKTKLLLPKLVRKVVPADNSCLFASLSFVILSDTSFSDDVRQLAASCILQDPETYNEAFLGKSNADYVDWLCKKEHWGGAIELNVLSRHYEVEINVADIQSGRIDRFGEDAHYKNRVFLLYDGIHYDALAMEENGAIAQTTFLTSDHNKQIEALQVAEECKKQRQFTDLAGFTLRCLICNTPLKGQTQAQEHAKQTQHMNFGEV